MQKRIFAAMARCSARIASMWVATALGIALAGPAAAADASNDNHLLVVAVCPPWKPKTDACTNNAQLIAPQLARHFAVPAGNVRSVVNSQGTSAGMLQEIERLRGAVGPRGRLVIYLNVHGGGEHETAQLPVNVNDHETFVFWTEQRPPSVLWAIADGSWLNASALKKAFDTVPAAQKVFIIDSCHSDLSAHDIFQGAHLQGEVLMSSARSRQFANFTDDGHHALFTQKLAEALGHAATGDVEAAFRTAAETTPQAAREQCRLQPEIHPGGLGCDQQPVLHDPQGVLWRLRD